MPSFTESVKVTFDRTLGDGGKVYKAVALELWALGSVVNGGVVCGLIVESVLAFSQGTKCPDVAHLAVHFLRPITFGPVEISVRLVKGGKFSNIVSEISQNNAVCATAHVLTGVLPSPEIAVKKSNHIDLTLLPPHPLATRTPFRQHPSLFTNDSALWYYNWSKSIKYSQDRQIDARSSAKYAVPQPANAEEIPIERGAWWTLHDEEPGRPLGQSAVAAVTDWQWCTPLLVPQAPVHGNTWFPTLFLSVDFKFKLSSISPDWADPHTLGVYNVGRFLSLGRFENQVEIWTAPARIGDTRHAQGSDWRDHMQCLATANIVSLSMDRSKNTRVGAKEKL